jgi:Tfp pilus assembly protein PilF
MHLDRSEYPQAMADFTIAIELDEDFALAYANRAITLERLGQTTAAAVDYRRALSLDPSLQQAHDGLERMKATGMSVGLIK